MMPTEQDGARLLAPLREVRPKAQPAVNVHRAVHIGARRLRIRWVATIVAVLGVTAIIVAVVPTVVNGLVDNEPQPPAAARFDVLRQSFSVGSAGGFTPVSYETGRYRQRVELGRAPDAEPGGPDRATVTMFAGGREPDGEPAPEVNGRRALWVSSTGAETKLAWELANRAWGFAEVSATGEDARAWAHRVAQSVAGGELLDQLGGRQRLSELANAVHLVGDPTDHTTWTGRPLR